MIPVLVIAGIITLLCLSGTRRERKFGWATLMVAISVLLVHFTWHFTWLTLLKYFGISIGIGLLYTAFKWVHGVSVYRARVNTSLAEITSWPSKVEVNTYDLDIGQMYIDKAESRKDALKRLTPQFSNYKAPALGWTIFWPFFILVDIAPIRVIEAVINSFSKPAQYFADKMFEDKDV